MEKGVKTRPGVSLRQVESFEDSHLVRLPPDLRAYYATIDGMEEGEADPDMFSFLPLKAVSAVPEELAYFGGIPNYREIVKSLAEPHRWFVIVDYLLTSAVYAIRLSATDEPASVLWIGSGKHHRMAASSFSNFLEAYLANPPSPSVAPDSRKAFDVLGPRGWVGFRCPKRVLVKVIWA
jgi:hypothetical protein